MNIKELISVVSAETNLPAAQVRKVVTAVLDQFSNLIETKGRFTSPAITITGLSLPARAGTEDKRERPERKFARMHIRKKKAKQDSAEADSPRLV
jgi:hypothetical protein